MSINSVLNNNISVQTNILNSRGETDSDVALKEITGTDNANVVLVTLDAEDSDSTNGLITRGFGINVPVPTTDTDPQTITLQFVDEHKATAATNLIETHLSTQAANGTGVVGYINANLLGATGVNSAKQIRLTRHNPNGQAMVAAYLEVRILDRDTTA
jgi:hypothetical protein